MKKFLLIATAVVILLGMSAFFWLYSQVFKQNIFLERESHTYVYIPANATMEQVIDTLKKHTHIKNVNSLVLTMKLKKYDRLIKPGRYKITNAMTNNDLVNMLRSGNQAPVRVTFNNIRTKEEFARKISKYFAFPADSLLKYLRDPQFVSQYGFDTNNILAMFIPNTYEFYWTTSVKGFFDRMKKEYDKFWNEERLEKARKIGLKPVEVIILASIVQAEQQKHPDERPKIAGVYLNRLKKGIPLEADPTVVYAIGDFSIKRVLKSMLEIDSPYNTYKNKGLPPGPILTPDITSIDAVLNAEKHNYLFFCAKEDFSGYHYFSKTLSQHNKYAEKYRQALNKLKIYK